MNRQQLFYIQSLFNSFNGETQFVGVTEKGGNKYRLEIYPSNGFLTYRVHFINGETSLWSSWEDIDDVEKYFKTASLL